jgi:hypothetical protein
MLWLLTREQSFSASLALVKDRLEAPEQTLLYQIIKRHYPEFKDVMGVKSKPLPLHV